jgi:hypothetical protein
LWEDGEIWIGELKLSRRKIRNKWNVWLKFWAQCILAWW